MKIWFWTLFGFVYIKLSPTVVKNAFQLWWVQQVTLWLRIKLALKQNECDKLRIALKRLPR